MALGLGVEASFEVGGVRLEVSGATDGVGIVVLVNTTSRIHGNVDASLKTEVGQIESADGIGSYRLLLMILAPIDIGPSSTSSAIQYMSWFDLLELGLDCLSVLHAYGRCVGLLSLALEQLLKVLGNPSSATENEETVVGGPVGCHCARVGEMWLSYKVL